MPTFYVRPVGSVSPGGNGLSEATAFNGFSDLQSRGLALTSSGDTIRFIGTFLISEFTYNTNGSYTITQGLPGNAFIAPIFGTNQVSTSSASGRIFDFRAATIDMRGATANTQRMNAGLIIRGESMTILGGLFIAPDWNYLFNDAIGTLSTRVPWNAGMGSGDGTLSEQASWENGGLIVAGCGNTVDGVTINGAYGNSGWCRHGLMMYISNSGMANATQNLTNTIKNCVVRGALTPISATAFGSGGSIIVPGTKIRIHDNLVTDPIWGWPAGYVRDEYNAGAHGNGIEVVLQANGLCDVWNNRIIGNFQDGLDFGAAGMCNGFSNYIADIGDPFIRHWQWDASLNSGAGAWWLKYRANTEGNGIKMGLAAEGTGSVAPSTWLGSDGTAGSTTLMTKEQFNRAWGNTILRVNSIGITNNSGRGCFIHANEIIDAKAGGINLFSTTAGNHCVTNNYVKLRDDANNTAAALYHGNLQRGIVINNILDGGANTACYDYFYVNGAVTITKTNNVYVRNRIGGTPPADTVAIASPGTLAWTQGQGLPSGHAYYTSGKGDVDLVSKMARGRMGLRGRPLDRAIGPFAAEASRVAR